MLFDALAEHDSEVNIRNYRCLPDASELMARLIAENLYPTPKMVRVSEDLYAKGRTEANAKLYPFLSLMKVSESIPPQHLHTTLHLCLEFVQEWHIASLAHCVVKP